MEILLLLFLCEWVSEWVKLSHQIIAFDRILAAAGHKRPSEPPLQARKMQIIMISRYTNNEWCCDLPLCHSPNEYIYLFIYIYIYGLVKAITIKSKHHDHNNNNNQERMITNYITTTSCIDRRTRRKNMTIARRIWCRWLWSRKT